jgi:hypothetical protein
MGLVEMLTLRVSKGRGLVGPAAARTRRVREANQKGSARRCQPQRDSRLGECRPILEIRPSMSGVRRNHMAHPPE